jgi:hypothetical protein
MYSVDGSIAISRLPKGQTKWISEGAIRFPIDDPADDAPTTALVDFDPDADAEWLALDDADDERLREHDGIGDIYGAPPATHLRQHGGKVGRPRDGRSLAPLVLDLLRRLVHFP